MSNRESFFQLESFAVVGHSERRSFPALSYNNLKKLGKQVWPVDLGGRGEIEGDKASSSLKALGQQVQGVLVEVPKDEVMSVLSQVADLGIHDVWLHQGTDTPEALGFAKEHQINLRHGTCAVMYTQRGFSYHSLHKGIAKLLGKY